MPDARSAAGTALLLLVECAGLANGAVCLATEAERPCEARPLSIGALYVDEVSLFCDQAAAGRVAGLVGAGLAQVAGGSVTQRECARTAWNLLRGICADDKEARL